MAMRERRLGDAIRTARMQKGYTQDKLSEMLGITLVHLANIEGGRRLPSVPLLFQIMELLDFSVDALVFPDRGSGGVLHTDGLTERQVEALSRLIDTMRP